MNISERLFHHRLKNEKIDKGRGRKREVVEEEEKGEENNDPREEA